MPSWSVTEEKMQSLISRHSTTTELNRVTLKARHQHSNSEDRIADISVLCSICQNISFSKIRGPDLDRMQPHQPSYLALKLSAESGCRLCSFFCKALSKGDEHNGNESAAAWRSVSSKYPGRQVSLVGWGGIESQFDRMYIVTTGEIPESEDDENQDASDPTMHPDHQITLQGTVEIYAHEDDPAAWHGKVNGRPLPEGSGDSDEDWCQIQKWLQTCRTEHANCNKPNPDVALPTRVIDVGPTDGSSEPRLWESKGSTGLYTTLSHCWGGKVSITTTTANKKEHMCAVPMRSLPKTFQDAVHITRKLGIRYLWIDSLCIVQDSAGDWQKESAMMEAIYRNGYLNISARGAADASVGCFFERPPEPSACRLRWTCEDCLDLKCSLTGSIFVRCPDRQSGSVRESPCDRRGWIFQEQILAPRVLYFGVDQIAWECCENSLRQDGRFDDHALMQFGNFPDFKVALGLSAIPSATKDVDSRSHSWWAKIVDEYTRRELTYGTDRLAALSGIAKAYERSTGKTYLAGNWKEELLSQLSWRRIGRASMTVSQNQPSWSWVKMSGRTRFRTAPRPSDKDAVACTLVDARIERNESLNRFDNFAKIEVDLRGHVLPVRYKEAPDDEFGFPGMNMFTRDDQQLGSLVSDVFHSKFLEDTDLECILLQSGIHATGIVIMRKPDSPQIYQRVGLLLGHTRSDNDGIYTAVQPFFLVEQTIVTIV